MFHLIWDINYRPLMHTIVKNVKTLNDKILLQATSDLWRLSPHKNASLIAKKKLLHIAGNKSQWRRSCDELYNDLWLLFNAWIYDALARYNVHPHLLSERKRETCTKVYWKREKSRSIANANKRKQREKVKGKCNSSNGRDLLLYLLLFAYPVASECKKAKHEVHGAKNKYIASYSLGVKVESRFLDEHQHRKQSTNTNGFCYIITFAHTIEFFRLRLIIETAFELRWNGRGQ